MMNNSDLFLLSKIENGDINAFERMFKKYYPKVKTMLVGLIKDEFIAENIAQDLFMNIWINRDKILNINSLESYMFICTRNAAINQIKNRKTIDNFSESEIDNIGENYTEESVLMEELQNIINEEIKKMPKQRQQIFIMSRFQGKTTAQIAQELNISPRTVEKHLSIALKTLRKIEYCLFILLININ